MMPYSERYSLWIRWYTVFMHILKNWISRKFRLRSKVGISLVCQSRMVKKLESISQRMRSYEKMKWMLFSLTRSVRIFGDIWQEKINDWNFSSLVLDTIWQTKKDLLFIAHFLIFPMDMRKMLCISNIIFWRWLIRSLSLKPSNFSEHSIHKKHSNQSFLMRSDWNDELPIREYDERQEPPIRKIRST